MTPRLTQLWELDWIQRVRLRRQTDTIEHGRLLIRHRQLSFFLQPLIKILSHRTVGSIGSDQNIGLVYGTVGTFDLNASFALHEGEDAFPAEDLFWRDEF